MDSALVCLVLLTSGMNFGWQPAAGDPAGYEYTVQVEPELLAKLKRGETVPIESNVPPEVTPIRKVRIVVGTGELARVPLAADATKLEKYDAKAARIGAPAAVVRGQAPDEGVGNKQVPRTTNFAADNGWPPGSSTEDRYNQTPGAAGGVLPPPSSSFIERSQSALSETSDTLQQGIDSGFQSARGQFQDLRSSTSQQLQQAGTAVGITSTSVSAPPWPSSATAPAGTASHSAIVRTKTGWTSIGGNLAAPPLMTPLPAASSMGAPRTAALSSNSTGPAFPLASSSPATGGATIRSELVDPNRTSTGANSPWPANSGTNFGSGQAGISRSGGTFEGSGDNGLVDVQPIPGSRSASQPSNQRYSDPSVQNDRFGAPQTLPAAQTAGFGAPPVAQNNNWAMPSAPAVTSNTGNAVAGSAPTNMVTQRQPSGNQSANQTPAGEPQPWLPLLVVSLSLIGSLSANFFLGWSYMDARQRYSSLVYRTASAFRRTTGDAAA